MRYPEFLSENGTIGFAAPSFGCASEPYKSAFDHALDRFRSMGYRTIEGPNCRVERGIGISNAPELCGAELNDLYCGSECDVLISCGGGELMCEVIPYMDFARLHKAKPKWFMGFSDNTNFTFLSATLCDTAAIYGPCASAFGMEPWHESVKDAWELLCGQRDTVHNYDKWEKEQLRDEEHPLLPYHTTEPVELKAYVPDGVGMRPAKATDADIHMQGRLIGGCMDCLVNLLGTRFDKASEFAQRYADDGLIWFLESCDLNIMGIRRAIWHMKHAGWFSHVKGFLIGRPLCFGEEMFGIDQYRAVTELLAEYQVPIIMDMDIGHLSPMMPMVCGSTAEVSCRDGQAGIRYLWT